MQIGLFDLAEKTQTKQIECETLYFRVCNILFDLAKKTQAKTNRMLNTLFKNV